jgi:iron complex transport system substrate-binding protein
MAAFSVESVLALAPDLVVAHPDLRAALEGRGLRVVWTPERQTYDNIPDLVGKLGAVLGLEAEAAALLERMRAKESALRSRTRDLPRTSVYYETTGPGWTVGGLGVMNAMIDLAGGRNIAADVPRTHTTITAEAIFAADPDVIVLGAFADPVEQVVARPGWDRLRAVRAGRVHHIRPERRNVAQGTPRCVEECEALLLPWLHPEVTAPAEGR